MREYHNTETQVLSTEEIVQLVGWLQTRKGNPAGRRAGRREEHQGIILLALRSGLRETEIARLMWRDVLVGSAIRRWVIPSRAKKGSRMPALISDSAMRCLEALPRRGKCIFGGGRGISRQAVWQTWKRIQLELWRCQIYTFHSLRHTAITEMYRMCRDIELTRQFARHRSYQTTQRYIHLVERERCIGMMEKIEAQTASVVGAIRRKNAIS